jgi:predicted esterase
MTSNFHHCPREGIVSNQNLEIASQLIKSGRIEQARLLLEQFIKEDLHNIQAWRLYAETCTNPKDRRRIWEFCLKHNPTNPLATQALAYLTSDYEQKQDFRSISEIPAPTSLNTRLADRYSQWLVAACMSMFIIVAILSVVVILLKAPINPQRYRHYWPVGYYLYVPKEYNADKEWPLFIGVYGAGGTGLDCWDLWQSHADEEGFILLCPTILPGNPDGTYPEQAKEVVWSAIDEVKKEYRIQQRMFLAGYSGGGYFIQDFTCRYPQYVSGLSILSTARYLDPKQFQEYVPILIVNSELDHPTVLYNSAAFSNQLYDLGFDYMITILPEELSDIGIQMTFELFRKTIGKDNRWGPWTGPW